MAGLNKVYILGRLGKDPEVKSVTGGKNVARIVVATSETWIKDGQKQERTDWHTIVVWGKLAELCGKYLKKGSQALFEGKIQTRSYESTAGEKKYVTEIIADSVQFLDSRREESSTPSGSWDLEEG